MMRKSLRLLGAVAMVFALGFGGAASSDEAPISGIVKQVDTSAGTLLLERTVRGKVRQVVVHMRPESKVLRGEQPAALADVKPGWTVNVKTKHGGGKEIAELVRVVHEK